MMIYSQFDLVEVPFPFTDKNLFKRRKAMVISSEEFQKQNNALILMMITSAAHSQWAGDVQIEYWKDAGLKKPCIARLKIFSLDSGLVISKVGHVSESDRNRITDSIKKYIF